MNKTYQHKTAAAGSLKNIFDGFRRISTTEQIAYLRYLDLLIERQHGRERRTLTHFKTKLEKEIKEYAAS